MATYKETAAELSRIARRVDVVYDDGSRGWGSGFLGPTERSVITAAHVVAPIGKTARDLRISGVAGATVKDLDRKLDLAVLETTTPSQGTSVPGTSADLVLGEPLMFVGYPAGVTGTSVFAAVLSAHGERLVSDPACRILQINGMINSGNSGGPVMRVGDTKVVGMITAKTVPLLQEIDRLLDILKGIPQFPSEVGIGKIDFSKFVNLMTQALVTVSGCLRLVQVGVGYAVPLDLKFRP